MIFLDANQNGQLDAGEVSVLSQRDDPNTAGIDETGFFLFEDLSIGDHHVTIVPQANVHATTQTTDLVTIGDSNDVGVVDFGMYPLDTRISGVLFEDLSRDNNFDAGEVALSGFTVFMDANANGLLDASETSVVTAVDDPGTAGIDESGRFEFTDLDEGDYLVAVVGQPGHLFLSPASLTLGFGSEPLDIELPIEANLTEISGTVFEDENSDGIRQTGVDIEAGLAGVFVYIDLNENGFYGSGEPWMHSLADNPSTEGIDELGTFSFTNLNLGDYTVVAEPPTGYQINSATSFSGTIDSSIDQFSGDFGLQFDGADVSGVLFDDLDSDGTQIAGEPPLPGLVVFADYNGDGLPSAGEPQDTTAADGSYMLANVIAGETAIAVVTADSRIVTSDVDQIPRLFVVNNQDIRELNPRDGAVLNEFNVSVSAAQGVELTGLAFDGTNLYAMDSFLDVVLVIDPDDDGIGSANIVDTIDLDVQPNQYITGLAVIGTTLYALDEINDSILTYDLVTGTLGASLDVAGLNANTTYHPGGFDLRNGLGESADETELVVSTTDQYRLYIDPATGLITGSDVGVNANDVGSGLAGASSRIYEGRASASGIKVFDASGALLTQLNYSSFADSLAAGPSGRPGALLNIVADQDVTGLNLGLASAAGSVSGTQFIDVNQSGDFDAGDSPIEGATVFADLNDNQWPDDGEPQAISGSDGSYTIDNVPFGTYSIRSVTDSKARPADTYAASNRLFAISPGARIEGIEFSMRVIEINPATGAKSRISIPGFRSLLFPKLRLMATAWWCSTIVKTWSTN